MEESIMAQEGAKSAVADTFNPLEEGFSVDGRKMPYGTERRVRLRTPQGSAYILTETGDKGAWQNAHHHQGMLETFMVQKGWIACASNEEGHRALGIYRPGEVFTSAIGIDHNVYMAPFSVIHTVQHGRPIGNPNKKGNDWYDADPLFDAWTKSLTVEEMARLTGTPFHELM